MSKMFKTIAIALAYSPTSHLLFREAKNLLDSGATKLVIIHAGQAAETQKKMLPELTAQYGIDDALVTYIESSDDPEQVMKKSCKTHDVDVLLMGAQVKEGVLSYYSGSMARNIMRDSPCSLFILVPDIRAGQQTFEKICVSVEFSPEGEDIVRKAYQLALQHGSRELVLLRELMVPGLAITVHDGGSNETEELRLQWEDTENKKLEMLARELKLTDVRVRFRIIYGKKGFEANRFAREEGVNLLIVQAQKRKFKLMDRIFQHDQEFLYKELPCSLLCVKEKP
ncbi:MAG: universal stress protein [Ignavibacteria bacterium]|nr:universal stress protein [Ignavibacteria bacterium]